jgi:hypothetical protein
MGELARIFGPSVGAGRAVLLLAFLLLAVVLFLPSDVPYRRLLGLVRAWRRARR